MFVQASAALPLGLAQARAALDRAIRDGGLVAESRRAHDEERAFLMRVGPLAHGRITKQVRVRVLPSREVGDQVVVPLRWEATGAAGRLFPTLDANLTLRADGDTTQVSIVGSYAPPLGPVGPALDHAAMSGLATSTVNVLLREVTDKLLRLAAG